MSRTRITRSSRAAATAALAAAALAVSLTGCAPAHPGAQSGTTTTARPHPTATRSSVAASPTATPTSAPRIAVLATSPGDELLTFSGTVHSANGSTAALSFTVHSPVPWNSAGGTSTLAALAAAGVRPTDDPDFELLDPAWDAAHGASLAVVDYSARMTAGSWVSGQAIELLLGPDDSEVALPSSGLTRDHQGPWSLAGPGSGRIVVAFTNSGSPDPSRWGDEFQSYGFEPAVGNFGGPNAYQLEQCRIGITPLGHRSDAVDGWYTPDAGYCSAGIGD